MKVVRSENLIVDKLLSFFSFFFLKGAAMASRGGGSGSGAGGGAGRGGRGGARSFQQPKYVPKVATPKAHFSPRQKGEVPKKQTKDEGVDVVSTINSNSSNSGSKVVISRPPAGLDQEPLLPGGSQSNDATERLKQTERLAIALNEEVDRKNAAERNLAKGTDKSVVYYVSELNEIKSSNAIDPRWANAIDILPFLPHDNDVSGSLFGSNAAAHRTSLLEVYSFIDEDLHRLLRAKHHVFWSHIIYRGSIILFIDTFLRFYRDTTFLPPPISSSVSSSDQTQREEGEQEQEQDEERVTREYERLLSLRESIFQRTFRVLLRMSQPKETSYEFLTEDFFARRVTPLFDLLKLIDISRIYGEYQHDELVKMNDRILSAMNPREISSQMRAITDQTTSVVSHLVRSIVLLFQRNQQILDQLVRDSSSGSILDLNQIGTTEQDFTEMIHYLFDIGSSMAKFLAFSRSFTCDAIYKNHLELYLHAKNPLSFIGVSVYIIELAVPMLRKIINANPTIQRRKMLLKRLSDTTESFLYILNAIKTTCFNDLILTAKTTSGEEAIEVDKKMEKFLFFVKDIRRISERISQSLSIDLPLCKIASGYCLGKFDLVFHLEKDVQIYKMKTHRLFVSSFLLFPSLSFSFLFFSIHVIETTVRRGGLRKRCRCCAASAKRCPR